jgi:hypothetical protein
MKRSAFRGIGYGFIKKSILFIFDLFHKITELSIYTKKVVTI